MFILDGGKFFFPFFRRFYDVLGHFFGSFRRTSERKKGRSSEVNELVRDRVRHALGVFGIPTVFWTGSNTILYSEITFMPKMECLGSLETTNTP